MLFLSNQDVESVLDMPSSIRAMEEAYEDLVDSRAGYRPRIDFYVPQEPPAHYYRWGTMEGTSRRLGVFAIRMKSDMLVWNRAGDFPTEEKYCIQPGTWCGLIFLLSTRNGEPLAIMNDGILQHMRVGACAGLGAKYLSRPDAKVVGMLGSGGMARTYAMAYCAVRPIERIQVFSPTLENRRRYAEEMTERLGIEVVPVNSAEEAARGADLLAAATDSLVPVLKPHLLAPGMHVTNVRGNEVGRELLTHLGLMVRLGTPTLPATDPLPSTFHGSDGMFAYCAGTPEEMDVVPKAATRVQDREGVATLPDIMAGRAAGRTSPDQITFLNNQGTQGLQFAAVGAVAYQRAKERGLGRTIPTEWFLQDIRD